MLVYNWVVFHQLQFVEDGFWVLSLDVIVSGSGF